MGNFINTDAYIHTQDRDGGENGSGNGSVKRRVEGRESLGTYKVVIEVIEVIRSEEARGGATPTITKLI